MRVRKKKNGDLRLQNCKDVVIYSKSEFPIPPYHIEIGCGKGDFICEMASRNPDKQYIAIEKVADVAMLCAEKIIKKEITNVKVFICDAKELTHFFNKGEVERIYLNFSDPWPKDRHSKRRLTYRSFLNVYKNILKDEGSIIFKTDNRNLFDFSLEEFKLSGFELHGLTYDLHSSELNSDNIQTEYERNFSAKGFNINRVEAVLHSQANINIKLATAKDIDAIYPLFIEAREYMKRNSIDQWQDGYPQKEVIIEDINKNQGYIATLNNEIVGYCAFCKEPDKSYKNIYDGNWLNDNQYYALHRIAISSKFKGLGIAGRFISHFSEISIADGIKNIRGDTHTDNRSMRRMFEKNGFIYTGKITLISGEPRVGYQRML